MDMHVHDCYEVYYSISGGKQFLIDNKLYEITPGDVFVINQYESHYLTQIDNSVHERIVLSVHPDYVKKLSTDTTDLSECFTRREKGFSHRLSLTKEQQQRFLYLINKITNANDFAHDVIEESAFLEILVLLNATLQKGCEQNVVSETKYSKQVEDILAYINLNISSNVRIEVIANQFYLSESYICRIFKKATGTTINKYVTARRITIAKALLDEGKSVSEAYEQSGFSDYSSFFKAFTKMVGISPKKYSLISNS